MRPLALAMPVSMLFALNAGAQTQAGPPPVDQQPPMVEVTAPDKPFQFWRYEAEWVSGGYRLSNGWRMDVEPTLHGIAAKIDKRRPVELIAVSRDRYVSSDGTMEMEFNRGAQGDEMTMSYIPDPRVAQVIVATAVMAQR